MPEQLTKHPDVTLQVLRSAGAAATSSAAAVPPPADLLAGAPLLFGGGGLLLGLVIGIGVSRLRRGP